jgi:lipoprotein-releasing system permease protein
LTNGRTCAVAWKNARNCRRFPGRLRPGLRGARRCQQGGTLIGIEPERYNRVIGLAERIVAGRLRVNAGEAVIGIELAKDLGAAVGDKLRLNAATAPADTLTITGLFDLGNKGVNARNVYVGLRRRKACSIWSAACRASTSALRDLAWPKGWPCASPPKPACRPIAGSRPTPSFSPRSPRSGCRATSSASSSPLGAFGIASVLVVSVVQRGKEIGILRAMGATQAQILRIFLLQGGIVGLLGSLLGSALAWSFLMLWRMLARNPDGTPMFMIGVEPELVVIAAGGASLVGILAALLPARRAANLDPVVAIRG